MHITSPLRRLAALAASVLIVGCGTDAPVALAPTPEHQVSLDEAGSAPEDTLGESVVLWPDYSIYQPPAPPSEMSASMSVGTTAAEPDIRIGVVQQAGTIRLGGTAAWTISDRANGVALLTGNGGSVAVTLASVSETHWYLQVMCASAGAVATRKAAAEALGYFTLLDNSLGWCTRLLIGRPSSGTWPARVAFRDKLISQGLAPATGSFWKQVTLGEAVYRIMHGGGVIDNVNPLVVTASDGGRITIGTSAWTTRPYRGHGEAVMNSAGTLAGINQLPMEQYLYGVVPRELGPIAYPEVEAQKAQAIAARTYAMAGRGKRGHDGYDLRATTSDQVYGGYADEHVVSNAAIDATRGIVARFNGALISTPYSSASGGHTSDNEEVFNGAAVAYLRGVPDAERGDAFEHVPTLEAFRAHANPTSLRNAAENGFETDWSTRHRWTYEWTAAEISSVLSAWKGSPVGAVHAINVTSRGPSGRALVVEYVTDAGTYTHARDAIRSSLRYVTASGAQVNLPSTLIFVEPVKENGQLTGGFRVYGGGFGHGVGMSQTGAVGMAQKGRTFDAILKHYYTGITLDPVY